MRLITPAFAAVNAHWSDVDDPPAVARGEAQERDGGTTDLVDPGKVYGQNPIPLRLWKSVYVHPVRQRVDPGVVNQNIQPPLLPLDLGQRLGDLRRIGDIHQQGALRGNIRAIDSRAVFRKAIRDCLADASRGPCDQRNSVL